MIYENGAYRFDGSVTATGKVGRRNVGIIGARVEDDKLVFEFPLGVGDLELPLP